MGTVLFRDDHFAAITGYGDYLQGNLTICHVYYVEGLGHNLFSIGQFCDADLEVAFRANTCYVRNLEGDDLLTGYRDSNLYTISISELAASFPKSYTHRGCMNNAYLSKTPEFLWAEAIATAYFTQNRSIVHTRSEDVRSERHICNLTHGSHGKVDVVFDGAFGGVGDEEVVVGEGVVVTSSSLEMLTNSCLGGIMVSLIFLEGLEEEALVEFMVELCEEDEDGRKNEKDGLFNLKI
ncbi:hypothetical protein Tco_0991181 [Tanacetum coccineum]|uniref:Integrase, catalytic region, zinc finger, CCHC-type, peptidase aspartic, catalytic n=1 Tax=Tanacetum coccineum TaxID=301880 RepID=A0ABQ5F090_9ASTR